VKLRAIQRILALALASALWGAAQSSNAEQSLTLDEAVNLALEKNEAIYISRESATSARTALSGAWGAYDPVFELSGNWRRLREPADYGTPDAFTDEEAQIARTSEGSAAFLQYLPTGGSLSLFAATSRGTTNSAFDPLSPSYQARVGVEFRQPLLRNLSMDGSRLAIRVARVDRRRSDAELHLVVLETVAAVERAYWNLSAVLAEVKVREEAVQLAEEQLAETEARVKNGAAPETELAQPLAELERRRGELFASREAASRAETALKTLILSDSDAGRWQDTLGVSEDGDLEIAPVNRGEAMERALALRPELEIARAAIDDREVKYKFARNNTWPALDAVLGYDRFGIAGSANPSASGGSGEPVVIHPGYSGGWGESWGNIGDNDFDDVRAGFVFSFPIGNRAARAAVKVARSARQQAEAELARARKAVRADVLNAFAALETAAQRIAAARAGREAAEIQLSAEKDRYKVGLTTNFLVLTRQNDLSRARLEEIFSRADYRAARTDFARATGALLGDYGIDIEQSMQ
jgi:outer membrane protein TolC